MSLAIGLRRDRSRALTWGALAARTAGAEATTGTTGTEATTGAAGTEATTTGATLPIVAAGATLPIMVVPHLASAVVVMAAVVMPVMPAARTGTEHEAAEEDDSDDEHGAGDDADPRGNEVEGAASTETLVVMRLDDRRCRGGRFDRSRCGVDDGASGRFW
jgi:hypothetical protein